MPLTEEPTSPSDDPTASTRWSYQDPSDLPLPADDPSLPFCARHATTIAHLKRSAFGPHPVGAGLPSPLRDWHFGRLDHVLARKTWCQACALISACVDTTVLSHVAEVIGCWVWDGVISEGMATLRLRIAPDLVEWQSAFTPFDLVPLDTGKTTTDDNVFFGRLVAPRQFDTTLVRTWVRACTAWHGKECVDTTTWRTEEWGVPFIRLISLSEDRLIESASPPPYVALSYVWGSAPVFVTLEGNISELLEPGGLRPQRFPKSIQDAISLARALDFDFLWVDSLCIIQDSPSDKSQQIRIIDGIYSCASLTIVAAAGADANAGIPGIKPGGRSLLQHTIQVSDDLTLVALHPDNHSSVGATTWNTRGWTYQERLLSRRCLFSLPGGSVSFQCAKAVWGEDYRAETPHLVRYAPMMDISLNRDWMNPGSSSERSLPTVRVKKTSYLQEYSRLVEEYTRRRMTYAGDRLLGLDGVLDVFRKEFGLQFIQGLPVTIVHMALLWQPRDRLKRVPKDEKTGLPLFPSWSWGGWIGQIGYEDWNEFMGLPELAERPSRVVPFSKLRIPGSTNIEPFPIGTHGRELPSGWSKVSTTHDGVCYIFGQGMERYHPVPFIAPSASLSSAQARISQPLGLHLRTRVAPFRLTTLSRQHIKSRQRNIAERRGLFGLSQPSPATSDEPWLGSILLPALYQGKLDRDHEFIILSESYEFGSHEASPSSFATKLPPFAVYDVMMIHRIVGEELEKYHAQPLYTIDETTTASEADYSWGESAVVERIGVGRMVKTAWEDSDEVWEDFILV
ncbi:heterokaryon incompatibility protein-domain-containing protein [Hypomontagnella monticulosa]|nr:heterokaryon incompatibility protein-domain-containing protein [Hypomontagnella monticulosa]